MIKIVEVYLSDILKRCEYNLERTLLIRHTSKNDRFVNSYREGFLREYTQNQLPNFYDKYDIVIVFSADESTTAKYLKSYEVRHGKKANISENCPAYLRDPYKGQVMHPLFEINNDPLQTYENKLFIEWGKATVKWYQKGTNEKAITRLGNTNQYVFPGYENIILRYKELKQILNNKQLYTDWHTALGSINAIYGITDLSNGKIYIGSSYNTSGLLGRWSDYVKTIHGGNIELIKLLENKTYAHFDLQYTILKVLPKDISALEAIEIESLYKQKLQTIKYGYNRN